MCKTVAPERGARIARMHSDQAQRFWGKSRNINEHVMNESCHTHKRHVTHRNQSRHAQTLVMSRTGMSHVTQRNKFCHTCKAPRQCVVVARCKCQKVNACVINESCHTHTWVDSYTELSHDTPKKTSCHTLECVTSHGNKLCHTRLY